MHECYDLVSRVSSSECAERPVRTLPSLFRGVTDRLTRDQQRRIAETYISMLVSALSSAHAVMCDMR